MEGAWYFVHEGQPQGPVGAAGLLELVMQGVLREDTLVCQDGWDEWRKLADTDLAEALPRVAKRQRLGDAGGRAPPEPELLREIPRWVQALDEPCSIALFEKALFHYLEDAIEGRPELRDALLTAYVQHHPSSDDPNPSAYKFTDEFLLEAIEDFDSREEMWEVLGKDNAGAVHALVGAAAALDRAYCGQLQSLALLSRARRLLAGAGDGGSAAANSGGAQAAGQQLLALLRDEPGLAIAGDMEGRSLWHDLVAAGNDALLRLLLPQAAATEAGGGGSAAGGHEQQAAAGQQQGQLGGQQRAEGNQQVAGEQAASRAAQPNPLNLPDLLGNTPLHLAAEGSHLEAARLLIQAGASLDMQNRDPSKYAAGNWSVRTKDLEFAIPVPSLHQTPLHIAAEAGDLEMMQLLVQAGALLDLRDASGSTPLHLALEAQDERALALLLRAGASPVLFSNDMGEDSTPLHAAAAAGRPGILRALLDAWPAERLPAAVNQPGENGWTPLMLSARRGSADCVRLLLERGADPAEKNGHGRTAADIAAVNKRQAVVTVLAEHAAAAGGT
ncbi:hypothetical protein ABPG75_013549 [Micractinium tetrahymenae]